MPRKFFFFFLFASHEREVGNSSQIATTTLKTRCETRLANNFTECRIAAANSHPMLKDKCEFPNAPVCPSTWRRIAIEMQSNASTQFGMNSNSSPCKYPSLESLTSRLGCQTPTMFVYDVKNTSSRCKRRIG